MPYFYSSNNHPTSFVPAFSKSLTCALHERNCLLSPMNGTVAPPPPIQEINSYSNDTCPSIHLSPTTQAQYVQVDDNQVLMGLNQMAQKVYGNTHYQPIATQVTQQTTVHSNKKNTETTKPKRKYDTMIPGRNRTEKKTFQQVMLISALSLLGVDVQVSRGSAKAKIAQNLYVDQMKDNENKQVLFSNNDEFEAFCRILNPQMSMKDKKNIVIAVEMQLIISALEEMGFEFDVKTTDKSGTKFINTIQYPILNSMKASDVTQGFPVINCAAPEIGRNLYHKLMDKRMVNNTYTYEKQIINASKYTFDAITQDFVDNINRFGYLNQAHVRHIIKNELAQRIWKF